MFNQLTIFQQLILFAFVLSVDNCKQNANNAFIVEYFLRRAPATVVGFTCDQYESK